MDRLRPLCHQSAEIAYDETVWPAYVKYVACAIRDLEIVVHEVHVGQDPGREATVVKKTGSLYGCVDALFFEGFQERPDIIGVQSAFPARKRHSASRVPIIRAVLEQDSDEIIHAIVSADKSQPLPGARGHARCAPIARISPDKCVRFTINGGLRANIRTRTTPDAVSDVIRDLGSRVPSLRILAENTP